MDYARPTELEEALLLLKKKPWTVLAGGTDFYPALGAGPLKQDVLDINGLPELAGITETDDHVAIGARTSWTEIIRHPLPPAFDMLKQAAREVGSIQIQNRGTVAGNLCNASPAADGMPPLLALDTRVELRSADEGQRLVRLSEFVLGNRKTALRPGELVTAVHVPRHATAGRSSFVKLGSRRFLVISIAMAAARIALEGERIVEAAVAVGSCSAVAQRIEGLEQALIGRYISNISELVADYPLSELSPIDDVRGSAEYRRLGAREIVERALLQAAFTDAERGVAA